MISFFENGDIQIKRYLCNCENCLVGEFKLCHLNENNTSDQLPNEIEELGESNTNDMYTFVEEGSFVGVYSTEKSLESFYIKCN